MFSSSEMNDEEKNAFLKEKMRQRIETMKITHMVCSCELTYFLYMTKTICGIQI